jgi:hypothetical protein
LRNYILGHALESVITDDLRLSWEDFVEDNFNQTEVNTILAQVNWDAWIYEPGLPPVQLDFTTTESN